MAICRYYVITMWKKLGELLEKLSSFLYYTESTVIESKPAAKYISALLWYINVQRLISE